MQQAPGFAHTSHGQVLVNRTAEERLEARLEVRPIGADATGEPVEPPFPRVLRPQDSRGLDRGPPGAWTKSRDVTWPAPYHRPDRGTVREATAPALEAHPTDERTDNRPLTP